MGLACGRFTGRDSGREAGFDAADYAGPLHFMDRFRAPHGVLVTRETSGWDAGKRILAMPLANFLLAF